MTRAPWLFVPFAALCLTGCRFGEARFITDLDVDAAFDPGGTVFSYLDERDANLVEDRDPRVVVAMTWVVFDPKSDLSDLDGASLSAMAHEMSRRDALALVFDHQGDVDAGEAFAHDSEQGEIVGGAELVVQTHVAPERLTGDSSFADFAPLASRRLTTVLVEAASFDDADGVVAGTVGIEFASVAGRDPGSAVEGLIEGTFRAPLVDERVAEANLALLRDLSGATLDLPLGPR
jgi:hypothetical protein